MRSHGPSCKRWRCSIQLLFHFPCWTWSITLNVKFVQSSLTSSSPPSLLSFVTTFLFTVFLLSRLRIAPNNWSNARCTKSYFQQVFISPKHIPIEGVMPPFPRHCNLPRDDFSTCISDVWDIAPPVGLQLYRSWMHWTEDLMEILNIQLSCIVNLWTCAQN